jgi:glutathione peroxidase-family protein
MPYAIGETVAPFTLPRAEGGDLTVDPSENAATVVVFTANHCPYALAWHERIQDIARDYEDRGVAVVQINANDASRHPSDSLESSAARVAAGAFASPFVIDGSQDVARAWGATNTPHVFVLDGSGALAYRGAPDADYEDPEQNGSYVRDALDEILAGEAVSRAETEAVGCTVKWAAEPLQLGLRAASD